MLVDIIDIFLRGLCVGLASSITVGPVAVLCIQRTLSKDRRSGLASGMGVASADMLMAIIAFLEGNSYEEVLRIAISLGGDADTIACMASSISVHLYGVPQGLYEDGRRLIPNDMKAIIDEFDEKYISISKSPKHEIKYYGR